MTSRVVFFVCLAVLFVSTNALAQRALEDRYSESPAHKAAMISIFKGLKHPAWIKQYGYGGWGETKKIVTIDGGNYEYYETCEPRNCGAHQMIAVITPDGRQAWAVTITDQVISFYGNPQGGIRRLLERQARQAIADSTVITTPTPTRSK